MNGICDTGTSAAGGKRRDLGADRDARIVVKPNLNNDLVALTGNCVDLRVLEALFVGLRRRGYRDLTVADGSNEIGRAHV